MSDNRKIVCNSKKMEYNSLAACINSEYCKKYNYDFLYYRPYLKNKDATLLHNCIDPHTNKSRHASWSKLLSTYLALKLDYDYVIYIDSDCIFKDFNQSIEDFISPYLDKDILFMNDKPWSNIRPNAGFYILKLNSYTQKFIKDWYNVRLPQHNTVHSYEQMALYTIYEKYNHVIIDSWVFEEKEDQYLRHISHGDNHMRIPYFNDFIKSNNISIELINSIKVIEYETVECLKSI